MKNISFFIVISITVSATIFFNYMNNFPNFNDLSIEQKLQTVMTKEYILQIFSKYLWKIYQMRQNKLFV